MSESERIHVNGNPGANHDIAEDTKAGPSYSLAAPGNGPAANATLPMVEPLGGTPEEAVTSTIATSQQLNKPPAPNAVAVWPELHDDHELYKFLVDLPDIIQKAGYEEVYGINLKPRESTTPFDFQTLLILQKFLRANSGDLDKAKEQLVKTLVWRKQFRPDRAVLEVFRKDKFDGLGFVTVASNEEVESRQEVITWNVYGVVKDYEKTFVPLDDFIRWRIGLMEFGVRKLNLANATQPIPDYGKGPDPYQGIQVHDYQNVSFLRMDSRAKAASKKTIELLSSFYPETLSRKFFVNVPIVMQWMFATMRLFVSAETTRKFSVLNDGTLVAVEIGDAVPSEYGGKLGPLSIVGESMKLE